VIEAAGGPTAARPGRACAACQRQLAASPCFRFVLDGGQTVVKCGRCAPRHPPLVRKALATSLVVGTILTAINQGDMLLAGQLAPVLLWKIPLTYFVPFAVSTYSALAISRVKS
jgi:hypothetical protein